jgi:hypothetical protein
MINLQVAWQRLNTNARRRKQQELNKKNKIYLYEETSIFFLVKTVFWLK